MPYRNAREALEVRCSSIESQLAQLRARRAEVEGLLTEIPALEASLADARAQLTAVTAGTEPSPLDRIQIAAPCTAKWDAMDGDDQVRFCGDCKKNVYNISAMARDEAEALLADRTGSLCVRLYRRADGTVLTGDCPEGVSKRRRRRVALAVFGSGALAAAAAVGMGARQARAAAIEPCSLSPAPVEHEMMGQMTMGDVATPETPAIETPRAHLVGRVRSPVVSQQPASPASPSSGAHRRR